MDWTGVAELIVGIILIVVGIYLGYLFLPMLIAVILGIVGIGLVLGGILLLVIGYITVKE